MIERRFKLTRRVAGILLTIAWLCLTSSCGTLGVPDMIGDPADTTGYQLEPLSTTFVASFARGNDIYLLTPEGRILLVSDSDVNAAPTDLGSPFSGWGRSLYVTKAGAIFASGDHRQLYRSTDNGATFKAVLDSPVWRMDEDELGNLYAGNYIKDADHIATLYKSTDAGDTWSIVFSEATNHHIHTVRWADDQKRLYIAYGDGSTRGQAYSDDRGATWKTIAAAPDQGHTDVALTTQHIIWASDDQSGRIFTVDKSTGRTIQTLRDDVQFMWFAVSGGDQVFVGSAVSNAGQRAVLVASPDGGMTWQKLLISPETASEAYSDGMIAESRYLSANGWLYFTRSGATIQSYRVRKSP
ncbi:MAG TPA: hypothetical protein VMV81_04635 [Phycisphaerae bacterium]|nr:hypothetical protein [Phycisphaerae bacterium]